MRKLLTLLMLLAGADLAAAQEFRGSLSNMARYIQMRPIARDTVDSASTTIDENGRRIFEGRPVFCFAETCTFYRPAAVEHTIAMSQDLSLTAWGFGLEGVSATVFLRARQDLAGEFTWPRYDDPFDAVLAYAELARERYRLRLGRQRSLTGLGFYSFDGISAYVTAIDWLNIELYGGRSLARALEEPRREALEGIENFIPDNEAWLIGAAAELHARNGMAGTMRYQRELWSDRAALISERASADFRSSLLGLLNVEAAADYDVAYNRIGKAHVTLQRQLMQNRLSLEATGRRYLPFFELWTIWGVFSPVAYHEAELQAGYSINPRFDVWGRAGIRKYEDADAAIFIAPAEDQTVNLALRGRGRWGEKLTVDAEYRMERGYGAYLSSGEASAGWLMSDRLRLGAYATAFQQILEFRTGEAAVFGGGVTFDFGLTDALQLSGGATMYQQGFQNRPSAVDWNQKRAWLGAEWRFGRDPGVATVEP
ncbi:MAG TPA: hypothetical protein VFO52_15825 [Longimicrobiales bacterium]|nr:hypothetical protein [Longimicrobiales bacterium]